MKNRKLIGLLAEKGITQRELAKMLNKSKTTINAKLNGKRSWDTDEAIILCDVLAIADNDIKVEIFLS